MKRSNWCWLKHHWIYSSFNLVGRFPMHRECKYCKTKQQRNLSIGDPLWNEVLNWDA